MDVNPADYIYLVHQCAKNFSRRMKLPPQDWDDTVQNGMFGLMRAAQKFDPARGVLFSTYACWWITATMRREFDETHDFVRVPVGTRQKGTLVPHPFSLDAPVGEDNETFYGITPDLGASPEAIAEVSEKREIIWEEIRKLPSDMQEVLYGHYVEEKTFDQIGENMVPRRPSRRKEKQGGLTRERVRQIEAKALEKLRHRLSGRVEAA